MTDVERNRWPAAAHDGVAHVELIARLLPGATVVERIVRAPVATVWPFVADLESSIPAFDRTVSSVRITRRTGDVLRMRVRPRFLPAIDFTCHLGSDSVVMATAKGLYVVAMGVRPIDAERCLYVQVEGTARRRLRFLNRAVRRHVHHDADTLARLVAGPDGAP